MAQGDASQEIEEIKSTVARYFPVYDVTVSYESITLFVSPLYETLESDFDRLRKEMMERGYIPVLKKRMGEHIISVIRKPQVKTRSIWVNRTLLVATIATTMFAGAFLWAGYKSTGIFTLDSFLWGGVLFALPLLTILGAHELAHYLMARRHGLDASLPFFIPSIPPLGTFGAFISMRDPMPSRKALLDIGIAGPLAGLAVTLPVTIIGLYLTAQGNVPAGAIGAEGGLGLMLQPLFQVFMYLVPIPEGAALHPTAFAAWVGFLVTAINLLPAGQLDGGHIARALLGDKARYLSYITAGILVIMSFYFTGWIFFALIIFFLGLRHPAPLNDISGLDAKRLVVGGFAFVILLATFVPVPVVNVSADYSFDLDPQGPNSTIAVPGEVVSLVVIVNNTGNSDIALTMSMEEVPYGWGAAIYPEGSPSEDSTDTLNLNLPYDGSATVIVEIRVPLEASPGDEKALLLRSVSQDTVRTLEFTVQLIA